MSSTLGRLPSYGVFLVCPSADFDRKGTSSAAPSLASNRDRISGKPPCKYRFILITDFRQYLYGGGCPDIDNL